MTPGEREDVRLTADVVLFADIDSEPHVLLVERGWEPFKGCWALPGGHVDLGETVEGAARRELVEETGIDAPTLTFSGVYSTPGRDPRGRYVTFAYTARLDVPVEPTAGDDATAARWVPLAWVASNPDWVAFDHHQIITDAARSTTPTIPVLYDPEADTQRGDIVRSLVEDGLWICAPDDSADGVAWRGPLDDPTRPAAWTEPAFLPEHLVLVARSVPVAQPASDSPAGA